jgi:hypothetical protein
MLWPNLSKEAVAVLRDLISSGEICAKPTCILTYAIDGATLNMPLATQLRNYKTPRWLPVVFNIKEV